MSEDGTLEMPQGWVQTTLGEILTLNPRLWEAEPAEDDLVSFVPMAAVEAISGKIDTSRSQPWKAVKKGYTSFQDGDVLFAKITPSMENGKCAVAHGLIEGRGVGSTEFHVLRPTSAIHPYLLFYFLLQESYRREARARMKGAAGQLRVPPEFIRETQFHLPPLPEQCRIVEEIERRSSQLEAGIAALERAKANLKNYRASVLQSACEGRLVPTEAELARTEGREYEPADQLLTRILKERRATWEAEQLAKMEAQGKAPKDDKWKAKYKEPTGPDTSELPELPEGWVWATWEQLSTRVTVGHVGPMRHEYVQDGVPFLRSQNVRENRFDPTGLLYISPTFHKRLSKSTLHPGDLVVVRSGGVGVTCVIPESLGEANCSDLVIIQKPLGLNSQYGSFFMNSVAKGAVEAGQVGIALTHFNTRSVATLSVAVPPLVEQRRIVTEVEDRLSILDKLEVAIMANLKRAERLRQAVLKQAFEGKLVPQDPNDEPASVLLEHIREERARKAEEEKVRRKPARKKMAKTKRGLSGRSQPAGKKPLLEVLNGAAGHLTPEQLFNQSGYTPEDIEEFYEELKREVLAQRIEQERPNDAEVYLRAVGE